MKFCKRYVSMLVMAFILTGALSGCKDNSAMGAFEAMQPRDGSLMTQIAMSSEIKIYDDAGSSSIYQSSAAWDDCNGVRHMYDAVSNISIDGSELERTYSEAWSSQDGVYLKINETGWQEREAGTGAERPAALDIDAAISFINRLPKLAEKADIKKMPDDGIVITYAFDVNFSDVRKLAGGAADSIESQTVHVTCGFDPNGLVFVQADTVDDHNSSLKVRIDLIQWNAAAVDLAIPDEIMNPDQEHEFEVERQDDANLMAYASEVIIPEMLDDSELSGIAHELESAGVRFDKIQIERRAEFDELQYRTHGILENGAWYAVLSIEEHDGTDAVHDRVAELSEFNSAWYPEHPAGPDNWTCWGGKNLNGDLTVELLRADDDRVYLVQIACRDGADALLDDLVAYAEDMLSDIGM